MDVNTNNNNQIPATPTNNRNIVSTQGNNRQADTAYPSTLSAGLDTPSPAFEAAQVALTREIPSALPDSWLNEEDVNDQMLDNAVAEANRAIPNNFFSISYNIHEATNRIAISIYAHSGELIRELPPESRLETYARISEFVGLLFDRNA